MQAPPTMLAQQQPMPAVAPQVQSAVQMQMDAQMQAQQRAQAQAQMQAQQQAQAQAQIQQMQQMQMMEMQAHIARPSSAPGAPDAFASAPYMGMPHGMAPLERPSTSPLAKPLAAAPSTPKAFSPSPSGGDEESSPLTYQVYAADAAPSQRAMAPSQVSFSDVLRPKPSLGKRVGFALVGVCVVVGTAILIIAGTADDPPRTALPSASANASSVAGSAGTATPATAATTAVAVPPAEPPPVTTTAADAPATTPTTAKSAAPKPKASAAIGTATAPKPAPSLKGVALPPNPFGGAPAPSLKPPGKRK